ncbi:MAG: hypothetical protein ACXWUG_25615, partial [Polyangiales bacterium]
DNRLSDETGELGFAAVTEGELVYEANSKRAPLALRRRVEYQGFELEREVEAIDTFPPELAAKARHVLAEALARGEARHPGARRNQDAIDSIRETYRRSGGTTPKLGLAELTAHYERQLAHVNSIDEFRHTNVTVDADELVPRAVRERYAALPSTAAVRDRDVEIHYDVEETPNGLVGVARLRLPEKIARTLNEHELPTLDRPLRFIVTRGARGAARAATLAELQEELDRPFTEKEIADLERDAEEQRRARHERKHERRVRDTGEKLKEHRKLGDDRSDGRRKPKGAGGRFRPPGKPRGRRRRG